MTRTEQHANCISILLYSLVLLSAVSLFAQQTSTTTNAAVPQLVNFGGVLTDVNGKPLTGTVGVTFLLYKEDQGGAPLWLEAQNVQPDRTGHYKVMLGSTTSSGLPTDIFVAGEARWLGVQPQGQAEYPRVMLLSVPYALKAGDAATVGGLPPSAFVLAGAQGSGVTASSVATATPSAAPPAGTVTGSGTVNILPLWTSASNIGNSVLFQSGTGTTAKLGINTTTPASTLDVKGAGTVRGTLNLPATATATATKGANSQALDLAASAFSSTTAKAVNQTFQWQAEPASNNTSTPSGTLNLLFGAGTSAPAETGLKVGSNGQITFSTGQTFPGTGTGTVTSVASGAGLTGGPITGTGTLSIGPAGVTNAMLVNPSLTVSAGPGLTGGGPVALGDTTTLRVDTSLVPELTTPNTFTANQSVNGNLAVVNNATFKPFSVQSSSTFGTWMNLSNTSSGGHTWNIISAGGANAEGAGNFAITDLTGQSTILLEGNVNAGSLVTGATTINNMGCPGFGGIGFGAKGSTGCVNYSLLGEGVHTYLNRPTGGQILFRENNATEMVLASGGNLGIGTTTPQFPLHVNGTMRAETGLSLGGNATVAVDAPGVVGGHFTVLPNGNVGIGTATPTNTLDVRGGLTINSDTPMTSNPHMNFSTMFIGSLCQGQPQCGFGTGSMWGSFVPDHNIMITRITITLNSVIDPSCLPAAVYVQPIDSSSGQGMVPIPGNVNFVDSGALSFNVTAGVPLIVYPVVNNGGCSVGASAGGDVYMNTQYVMR